MKPCLNILLLTLAGIALYSCKKEPHFRGKEVNATVVLASGTSIEINTSPGSAYIGCGISYVYTQEPSAQGPSFIHGINDPYTAAVLLTIGDTCITQAGTYSFSCEYVKDYSGTRIVYSNEDVANPGSITYTTVKDDYVEGHFHATCKNESDSVSVSGTFNGYMN